MSTSKTDAPARASKVSFTGDVLNVVLTNGQKLVVPTVLYPRLKFGTPNERRNFRLIGSGTGIHWEDLEEDISIAHLLEGQGSAESPKSILKWLLNRQNQSPLSRSTKPKIRVVDVPNTSRASKRLNLGAKRKLAAKV